MSADCAMIRAEIEANNVQAQKLADENRAKVAQNVAAGVVGVVIWPVWFAMDAKGASWSMSASGIYPFTAFSASGTSADILGSDLSATPSLIEFISGDDDYTLFAASSGCFAFDAIACTPAADPTFIFAYNQYEEAGIANYGIDAESPIATITPLPAALPLYVTVLGFAGMLGWRRNRKNAAAIAAA